MNTLPLAFVALVDYYSALRHPQTNKRELKIASDFASTLTKTNFTLPSNKEEAMRTMTKIINHFSSLLSEICAIYSEKHKNKKNQKKGINSSSPSIYQVAGLLKSIIETEREGETTYEIYNNYINSVVLDLCSYLINSFFEEKTFDASFLEISENCTKIDPSLVMNTFFEIAIHRELESTLKFDTFQNLKADINKEFQKITNKVMSCKQIGNLGEEWKAFKEQIYSTFKVFRTQVEKRLNLKLDEKINNKVDEKVETRLNLKIDEKINNKVDEKVETKMIKVESVVQDIKSQVNTIQSTNVERLKEEWDNFKKEFNFGEYSVEFQEMKKLLEKQSKELKFYELQKEKSKTTNENQNEAVAALKSQIEELISLNKDLEQKNSELVKENDTLEEKVRNLKSKFDDQYHSLLRVENNYKTLQASNIKKTESLNRVIQYQSETISAQLKEIQELKRDRKEYDPKLTVNGVEDFAAKINFIYNYTLEERAKKYTLDLKDVLDNI